ncbi:MAG: hypothetical protein J5589_03130 [Firmicutes bacterium]|nr:hypothetical protein [Bacillota bacterium]
MKRMKCRRILLLILALGLILSSLTGCAKDIPTTDRDKVQHARERDDNDEDEYTKPAQEAKPAATTEAEPAEAAAEEPAREETASTAASRGNGTPYVEYQGKVYFWGFASETFWDTGTWGNYYTNGGVVIPLLAVDKNDPNAVPETVLTADGTGNIGILDGVLYYESKDESNQNCIKALSLDGTVGSIYSDLYGIVGADDESGVLICSSSYSGGVTLLDMASGLESMLAVDGKFIVAENGIVYYYTTPSKTMLSLGAYDIAGHVNYNLGTVSQTLWSESEMSTMGGTTIESAQIADGYLYICYGSRAGSGAIFQGGEIARFAISDLMNCPGAEPVYGSKDDDTESEIYVRSDGGVHTLYFTHYTKDYQLESVCMTVPGGEVQPTGLEENYLYAEGEIYTSKDYTSICVRPDLSGNVLTLVTTSDLTTLIATPRLNSGTDDGFMVGVRRVSIVGDWVYFAVEKGVYADSTGWRDEYKREWGVIMRKNLQTGVIQQLHSY